MLSIKNSKPVFYGLILTAILATVATQASVMGATPASPAADESQASAPKNGIISKTQCTPGSYCHRRFPAISRSTLVRTIRNFRVCKAET